ncbi:MAG: TolC family protein, partial [Prevotella sp.]|nr:TolC family protein [Prevotella sp.]
MRHRLYFVTALLLLAISGQAQTLEECQQAAERNYPLIRQRDLVGKLAELTVANIGKGWLPQVSASAQATLQSDVATFPDEMRAVYQQMGIDMKGLTKDQYRVGVDVSQTVFDGGAISRGKAVARQQGEVEAAQTEVSIYQVRRRVNEMYFALLLLDDQIQLNRDLQELLDGSERKLASMVKGGTAAECDLQNVKAERLNVAQQTTSLESQRRMLQSMLSVFCGMEVTSPSKPLLGDALAESADGLRPEMRLFDAQLHLADAQEKALDAALLPKLGVFAQGFYGYPGLNMFDDMMSREWSLNGLVGARLTWNIGALYTRKNDKAKIQLQRDLTETNRDVFVFNNRLEQIQQNENISRYRQLMAA